MKIGLYFGSFNPIHHGHLIIANHILQNHALHEVWFVISPQNPFKPSATLLNENHRYFLVQEAIEGVQGLKASNVEFHLPKPSYTIHTLTYLEEHYPQHEFHIIMGSDSFQNLPRWKNGDIILKNYPIIIYKRPGFDVESKALNITITEAPLLEISSTYIRDLIKRGLSIKYLVPDPVIKEIDKGMYYRK